MRPAKYKFIAPDGKIHQGRNVRKFAREHKLCPSNMNKVATGERNHNRGWRAHPDMWGGEGC